MKYNNIRIISLYQLLIILLFGCSSDQNIRTISKEENSRLEKELIIACYYGNVEKINSLIEQGVNVNSKYLGDPLHGLYDISEKKYGFETICTPLFAAVDLFHPLLKKTPTEDAKLRVVQLLIDANVNLDQDNGNGGTPLYRVLCNPDYVLYKEEIALALINAGACVEGTPLHRAFGSPCIVKALIAHGADVNSKDTAGNTPLYYAFVFGHVEAFKILVEEGADVNVLKKEDEHIKLLISIVNDSRDLIKSAQNDPDMDSSLKDAINRRFKDNDLIQRSEHMIQYLNNYGFNIFENSVK